MLGRLGLALPARQEGDARHRRRDVTLEAAHRRFGDLLPADARLAAFLPEMTMLGFSTMPSRWMRCSKQLLEHGLEHRVGHFLAALERVVAVHQHFGLDDRDDVRFLAQRRVAGERVRIGVDGEPRRNRLRRCR